MQASTYRAIIVAMFFSSAVMIGGLMRAQSKSDAPAPIKNDSVRLDSRIHSGPVDYVVWQRTNGIVEGLSRGTEKLPGVNSLIANRKLTATVFPDWVSLRPEAGGSSQYIPRDRIVELHFLDE